MAVTVMCIFKDPVTHPHSLYGHAFCRGEYCTYFLITLLSVKAVRMFVDIPMSEGSK